MTRPASDFPSLPSTCVADALKGEHSLDWRIKPIYPGLTVCGRAFTASMPAGDNEAVLRAIHAAGPGSVLVVDAKGYGQRAAAGDFVIGLAKAAGLAGVVVDGCIRDITGISALRFPVFCRGTTPSASVKGGGGAVNIPISCGGVSVAPGDLVYGDDDGVVIIPQGEEERVFEAAKKKFAADEKRAQTFLQSRETALQYLEKTLGL